MSEEALLLAATVVDKFSQPLKDLQRQLRATTTEAERHGQRTTPALAKQNVEFLKLRDHVTRLGSTLRSDFLPQLEKLGLAALGGAGAFGALGVAAAAAGVAIKTGLGFATPIRELDDWSRATGLSITNLQAWQEFAKRTGTSAEAMAADLKAASGVFQTLDRDAQGTTYVLQKVWNATQNPRIQAAVAGLKGKSREAQLESLPNIADMIATPVDKRRFWAIWGLPEDFAERSSKEIKDALADIRAHTTTWSDQQVKDARAAEDAFNKLKQRIGDLQMQFEGLFVGPARVALQDLVKGFDAVGPAATTAAAGIRSTFGEIEAGVLATKGVPESLAAISTAAADISTVLGPLVELADSTAIKGLTAGFKDVGETLRQFAVVDVSGIVEGFGAISKLVEDVKKLRLDWRAILDVDGLEEIGKGIEARFDWLKRLVEHPFASHEQYGPPMPPPQVLTGQTSEVLRDRAASSPAVAPLALPPAPLGLPRPIIRTPKPAYSPIAFNPATEGLPIDRPPNPLANAGAQGASSSTNDMINIIAAGSRRGVRDGMTDFMNDMRTIGVGGSGAGGLIKPASYELGAGSGGSGGGIPGGAEGPAGKLGADIRRGAGGGVGSYTYSPSDAPAGSLTKLIGDAASSAAAEPGARRSADQVRKIMEGIRAGESGHGSQYDKKDDALESSWGPFQLNRRRGMGVDFERDTAAERKRLGLGDLHDPRTMQMQADWVAKYLARGGSTAPWMGFHGAREADPRWGNAGLIADKLRKEIGDVSTAGSKPHTPEYVKSHSGYFGTPGDDDPSTWKRTKPPKIDLGAPTVALATGGSFDVGGKPGRDANKVVLGLTRGEHVEVTNPVDRPSKFTTSVYAAAKALGLGDAQAKLAASQSALETGYGQFAPGSNFFGLKGGSNWRGPTTMQDTGEETASGSKYRVNAAFRSYSDIAESIKDYVSTMKELWPKSMSAQNFGDAMKGLYHGKYGDYSTDTRYRDSLEETRNQIQQRNNSSLLLRESGSLLKAQAEAVQHRVTGEASLRVSLADGLKPQGGIRTKGDLFREVKLDRVPPAMAMTTG